MDCRIDVAELRDRRVVRLAGRLADAQVPELLAACGKKGVQVDLNLGDLISVDAVGLDALDRLRRAGATLIDAPAYIQRKLDTLSVRSHS